MKIRIYASTKPGIEKPATAKTMTTRSIQVPAFHAAMTPSGMAIGMVTSKVEMVSATVGSMRCLISVITGRLVKMEMPRSPCSRFHTQVPNWT